MEYKTPKADDPMQVLLSAKNDEKSRFGQTRKTLQSSIESEQQSTIEKNDRGSVEVEFEKMETERGPAAADN